MVKPEIETWYDENGKLCLRIKVPTLKIAKQMLNGLKKRHPEIDVNELENKIEWRDEYINEMIYFEAYMGGNDFQRALSKIAINYYLHEGGDIDKIKSMISYLKDEINLGVNVNEYYSFVGDFHEINDDEVSHLLFLKGDSKKRLLYCYIELFSCYNFMVILSDNYADKDFEKTYCYDILKKKELSLNKNVKLTLLRHPFRGMGRYNRREYHDEYLTKKIERLYQLFGIVSISSTKPINN